MINPPPKVADNLTFDRWMYRFWAEKPVTAFGITDHALLANLNSTDFSHLTNAQLTSLTGGSDSILHFHSSDRDRANHTGTQTSSTISDFAIAAQAAVSLQSNILENQVFGN